MFKAYHNLLPENLQNNFVLSVNDRYDTKRKNNFKQNYVRTRKKQLCISTAGIKLWNSLDDRLKNCKTMYSFKSMYKQHLLLS